MDETTEPSGPVDGVQLPVIDLLPFTSKRFRACASCEFGVKEQSDLVCRRHPPQVTFLALPGMVPTPQGPRQGFQIVPHTSFPIMRPDQWCGEYKVRA